MKKILCGMLFCIATSFTAKAQIGYQVSLLNTATGEPRTNVTVNAAVTITDSKGGVIYSGSQSATSNDFGVLSLTVGNANTFKNVDFSKLPFFIQVSVDGKMIGRSQILNVPVAEAAKTLVPTISEEEICGTWNTYNDCSVTLRTGGSCSYTIREGSWSDTRNGTYEIEGNNIYCFFSDDWGNYIYHLRYHNGKVYAVDDM